MKIVIVLAMPTKSVRSFWSSGVLAAGKTDSSFFPRSRELSFEVWGRGK